MTEDEHFEAARLFSLALGALSELVPWCDVGPAMALVRGCVLALWSQFTRDYPGRRNPYNEVP